MNALFLEVFKDGFEQPGVVEVVPVHVQIGTRWSLGFLPNEVVLWFYDISSLLLYRTLLSSDTCALPPLWQRQWSMFSKKERLQPEKPSKWALAQVVARKTCLMAVFLFNSIKKTVVLLFPFSADISQMAYSFCWGHEGMVFSYETIFFGFSKSLNRMTSPTEGSSLQISTC